MYKENERNRLVQLYPFLFAWGAASLLPSGTAKSELYLKQDIIKNK